MINRGGSQLKSTLNSAAPSMRFGVKPERPGFLDRARSRYSSSTYKLSSDSEDSSSDEFREEVIETSDSEDSFCYASESEIPTKSKLIAFINSYLTLLTRN